MINVYYNQRKESIKQFAVGSCQLFKSQRQIIWQSLAQLDMPFQVLEIILTQVGLTGNRQYWKYAGFLRTPEIKSEKELPRSLQLCKLDTVFYFRLHQSLHDAMILNDTAHLGHNSNCWVFLTKCSSSLVIYKPRGFFKKNSCDSSKDSHLDQKYILR